LLFAAFYFCFLWYLTFVFCGISFCFFAIPDWRLAQFSCSSWQHWTVNHYPLIIHRGHSCVPIAAKIDNYRIPKLPLDTSFSNSWPETWKVNLETRAMATLHSGHITIGSSSTSEASKARILSQTNSSMTDLSVL
jgi:hypothetical protein